MKKQRNPIPAIMMNVLTERWTKRRIMQDLDCTPCFPMLLRISCLP